MKTYILYSITSIIAIFSAFSAAPDEFAQLLNDLRQVQIASQMFTSDAKSSGSDHVYPKSLTDLVTNNYITTEDIQRITKDSKVSFKAVPAKASTDFVFFLIQRDDLIGIINIGWKFNIVSSKEAEQGAAANP